MDIKSYWPAAVGIPIFLLPLAAGNGQHVNPAVYPALMSSSSYTVLASAAATCGEGIKAVLACFLILIVLLAFQELAETSTQQAQAVSSSFLRNLRNRVPILIWVLLVDLSCIVLVRIIIAAHWWPLGG